MTRADLLISDQEQTSLTKALASGDQPDPIAACIAEKSQKVAEIVGDAKLSDGTVTEVTRALVLYQLYYLIGPVTANVKDAYTEASKLLEQIKAGTYPPPRPATKRKRREFTNQNQDGI